MEIEGQVGESGVQSKQRIESSRFMKVITRISGVMVATSAAALGVMMFLTVVDVTGRKFMHPVNGSSELVGMLLIVAASLSLGWCQLTKGNISIDVFSKRLKPRGQAVLSIFSYLISVAVTAIACWQGTKMMLDYLATRGARTAVLGIVIWPFWLIIVIGFAWVTIVFCIDLYRSFAEALKK